MITVRPRICIWSAFNTLRHRNWLPFHRLQIKMHFSWMKMFKFRIFFKGLINNIPALILIMAWCRSGDRPLCEPMMVILPTHKCVSRPQWVNSLIPSEAYMHSLTRSSLVQVMPCRRFDTKTLTEPSLIYSQLNPGKYISMKFYLKF